MVLPLVAALAAAALSSPAPERVHDYAALAMSLAGDRVASLEEVEGEPGPTGGARPHPVVIIRSASDGRVLQRVDPCAACAYSGPVFSPDGSELAFVAADQAAGSATLEVSRGGAVRAVTVVRGVAQTPRWSPDGRTLALLAIPGARKAAGAIQAGVPLVGEIGAKTDEQRLGVVSAAGGELRFVSPADTYVYEYGWTPDGRGFAATAARGNGDDNWWVAKLVAYTVDGAPERVIAAPRLQMNEPRVSPDGREVLFIGGLMSDFGSVGGDVYAAPMAGGEPRDLTPGFRGTFTSVNWTGGRPLATALIVDRSALVALDGAGGAPRVLWSQPVSIAAGDGQAALDAGGNAVAFVAQDFTHAPRIFAGAFASPSPITHDNDALPPHVRARSLTWRSDNFQVQGWLVEPLDSPATPRALMVEVHGGPAAAATPTYVSAARLEGVLGHGYTVLRPNPRGSFGQGEAFTRANVRDFGGGDLRDILAGVDAATAAAGVDARRVAIMGASYGGFMTLYAVTHSDRFKAGVAGAGIADWYSYYGQNGIHQWMLPFFGASAYDDPQLYLRLSPIWTIKQAKTPTFIWVGERDIECPPAQSLELFNGLREMGVPTSLVIYPGEGHHMRQPEHTADVNRRTLEWLDRYMR